MDRLMDQAAPEAIARTALRMGCRSVAFTYNDPVIFHEYAVDVAQACREVGVRTVAVTAGFVCPEPREEFYRHMDAANIDLKGFSEDFYRKLAAGSLEPVTETLDYVCNETDVWVEITTLLIPGWNDSDAELKALTRWVVETLGPHVPLHFTAFHPDWKLRDVESTPGSTLDRARNIAIQNGAHFAYTGNVRDKAGGSTYCPGCGLRVIGRDWYVLSDWRLTANGSCQACGTTIPGHFDALPGSWGAHRQPVRIGE
jgi:pyruvate formate lyase activating enzyme